jgi:peptidoglycan/xylan/chitin deacetylase (PgdA/CDA1 family)
VRANGSRRRFLARCAGLAIAAGLPACAAPTREPARIAAPPPRPRVARVAPVVLGRDADWVVLIVREGDTLQSLAQRYLGDAGKAWWIADFNGVKAVRPGQDIAIPLKVPNAVGVFAHGYQTVPILCYHRLGSQPSRLVVSAAAFDAQMEHLANNGYRVVPLRDLRAFLEGGAALPSRAVVITFDDGYASTFEIAFPVLKRYNLPATVFLYTDFTGAPDALSWAQLNEMGASGLIEIQPHSKTHANLAVRLPGEDDAQYRARLAQEIAVPARLIRERTGRQAFSFAYPFGDVTEAVAEQVSKQGITLGLTVTPGANAFFASPLMLRRTMVFGEDDLAAFRSKLTVFSAVPAR